MNHRSLSKFLSLLLRHNPAAIGLELDPNGWADLDELLTKLHQHGKSASLGDIRAVVANNNKQRFKLDEANRRIRANQGHSIAVDVELPAQVPPPVLYHGTARRFLSAILGEGLKAMRRQHVHLSDKHDTAVQVGSRHGRPVVLTVQAGKMHRAGYTFYLSENGVWLTEAVPPDYLLTDAS